MSSQVSLVQWLLESDSELPHFSPPAKVTDGRRGHAIACHRAADRNLLETGWLKQERAPRALGWAYSARYGEHLHHDAMAPSSGGCGFQWYVKRQVRLMKRKLEEEGVFSLADEYRQSKEDAVARGGYCRRISETSTEWVFPDVLEQILAWADTRAKLFAKAETVLSQHLKRWPGSHGWVPGIMYGVPFKGDAERDLPIFSSRSFMDHMAGEHVHNSFCCLSIAHGSFHGDDRFVWANTVGSSTSGSDVLDSGEDGQGKIDVNEVKCSDISLCGNASKHDSGDTCDLDLLCADCEHCPSVLAPQGGSQVQVLCDFDEGCDFLGGPLTSVGRSVLQSSDSIAHAVCDASNLGDCQHVSVEGDVNMSVQAVSALCSHECNELRNGTCLPLSSQIDSHQVRLIPERDPAHVQCLWCKRVTSHVLGVNCSEGCCQSDLMRRECMHRRGAWHVCTAVVTAQESSQDDGPIHLTSRFDLEHDDWQPPSSSRFPCSGDASGVLAQSGAGASTETAEGTLGRHDRCDAGARHACCEVHSEVRTGTALASEGTSLKG